MTCIGPCARMTRTSLENGLVLTINYAPNCGSRCNKVSEWIMGFGVVLGLGLGSRPGTPSWYPRPEPVFRVLREGSVRSGIQG